MAKKYTREQWERFNNGLPPEDQVPYSDSPDVPDEKPAGNTKSWPQYDIIKGMLVNEDGTAFVPSVTTPTTPATPAAPAKPKTDAQKDAELGIPRTPATPVVDEQARIAEKRRLEEEAKAKKEADELPIGEDPYYKIDPKTGLSQAQIDAKAALQKALEGQLGAGKGEDMDKFKAIPFDLLPDSMKKVLEANAKAQGITALEYYNRRGGVNASGYYGDSYKPGVTLNDVEYTKAIDDALEAGKTGAAIGNVINNAAAEKAYQSAIKSGVDEAQAKADRDAEIARNNAALASATTAATTAAATAATTTAATTVATTSATTGAATTSTVTTPLTTTAPTTGTVTAPVTTTPTTVTGTGLLSPERQGIFDVLSDRFNKYGLGSLVPRIKELIMAGATEDTITIQLQESPEYQRRFRANAERLKKGLRVLSPVEYLNAEDGYRQVLRAYGLNQFDTDDYVSQFIQNDVSTAEFSNRVVNAVQRVRNADPAIAKTLRDYYGIGNTDLVAYVLDPNQQLPKIERQIAAAEIGTAARRQGLEAGVSVAEQLAAQGISQAEAQKGYATIADILPTAEKLSDIYGNVEEQYRQSEAEQEVFNQLASAQRKRRKLSEREIAAFSGQTGMTRASLTSQSKGQF